MIHIKPNMLDEASKFPRISFNFELAQNLHISGGGDLT